MIILRNKKNQTNKRGAMLILVLLIVALATVLISSALMMTRSTREHYYEYTKMSQVQLSATSVAEAIWDAISVQAIDDDMVLAMADAKAHLEFSGASIPGAVGGESYSYADFSNEGGKVVIDVVSYVGGEKASVKMTLTPPEPKSEANHFQYTVNMDGDGLIGEFNIGKGGETATDNTMLVRGTMNSNLGSTNIYSTLIATKPFQPASGQTFYGDVVLWGPNSGWNMGNGAGMKFSGSDNTLYFVSPDGTSQTALYGNNSGTNQNITNLKNIVFYNSKWNNTSKEMWNQLMHAENIAYNNYDNTFSGSPITDGTVQNNWNTYISGQTSSVQSTLINKARDYVSAKNIQNFSGDSLPSLSSQSSSFGVSTSPNGTTVATFDALSAYYVTPAADDTVSTQPYLKPGNYIISAGSLSGDLLLDLSKGSYVFYVLSSGTISGSFRAINGAKLDSNWVNMVLSNGQTLTVTGSIQTKDSVKPYLKIWGMGGTTISFPLDGSGGAVCEAYICMYDNPSDSKSQVLFNTGASCKFYGRITCSIIKRLNGGNFVDIPYCVDPTYKVNAGKIIPLETGFTVDPFQYYS